MKTLFVLVAIAMLGGCGSQVAPTGGAIPTGSAIPTGATSATHGKSWMAVDATAALQRASRTTSWVTPGSSSLKKLIYVSDTNHSVVLIFDYNTGAIVGHLSGFWDPQGQCVDARGDIFIADYSNVRMVEYAHGGSKPIKTLQTDGSPISCSVSPNGDLAAVYDHTPRSHQSEVVIFKHASGTPTVYKNAKCYYMLQPGYDHEGNLYVQGTTYKGGSKAEVCKIPKSGSPMQPVKSSADIVYPEGVMWDGKHIALSGESYSGSGTIIYQMKETTSGLAVASKTTLGVNGCNGTLVQEPFIVEQRTRL